jgi:succinyl-diaminopimelate desuccinylase
MTAPTDLLRLTADLVAMPSESFDEAAITDWLEAELQTCPHLVVTRVGDNLVARTELGREHRVVLGGHTDTVVANGNAEARIDGDTLWGLGSTDMKAGVAIMVELARSVADPVVDVTYVFYAREEVSIAHNGLRELFATVPDLLTGDVAVLGEPTGGTIEAGCQGTMRAAITLRGTRAHTARPWMGRNAIHRLGALLGALAAYEPRRPVVDGCEYHEAIQAVEIGGGVAGNIVPDEATVTVNHRFAPDRTPDQATEQLRSVVEPFLDDGDTFAVTDMSPPARPGLDHPLFRRMIDRSQLTVRAKLGWTDVAFFSEHGVPAVNLGPGDATLAHTADERVERAPIESTYATLHGLLTEL